MLPNLYLMILAAALLILSPLMVCLTFGPKAGRRVKRGLMTCLLLAPLVFLGTGLWLKTMSSDQLIMTFVPLFEGCLLACGVVFIIGQTRYFLSDKLKSQPAE